MFKRGVTIGHPRRHPRRSPNRPHSSDGSLAISYPSQQIRRKQFRLDPLFAERLYFLFCKSELSDQVRLRISFRGKHP